MDDIERISNQKQKIVDDISSGIYDLLDDNSRLKNEINRLEKANNNSYDFVEKKVEKSSVLPTYDVNVTDDDDIVDFYYNDLVSIEDISVDSVREFLPVKDNSDYSNIINRIILEIKKDIKTIQELIIYESDNMSKSDYEDMQNDINRYNMLIKCINEVANEKEDIKDKECINKLIYLPKQSNQPYLYDDFKKIAEEAYPSFIELFQSIENGTFKSLKHFNKATSNKLYGIWEVRGDQVRVVFDRIGKHVYVIIAAFVKKDDASKAYEEFMVLRNQIYRNNIKYLKEMINDEEFMLEQDIITCNLYSMINQNLDNGGVILAKRKDN